MFGFVKRLYEPIRKGNEHRLEKYGNPDTFEESYQKARKIAKDQRDSILRPTQSTEERNSILRYAAAWERWTGSRFIQFIKCQRTNTESLHGQTTAPLNFQQIKDTLLAVVQ
jgi:hypothetical protein